MKFNRIAGILLPITALPEKYGIGSLGKAAYEFINFLSETDLKIWQFLPLGPTGYGNSPYQAVSAFAGNEYLIDLTILQSQKLLTISECENEYFGDNIHRVDYGALFSNRIKLLRKAYSRFDINTSEFIEFCKDDEMVNYALFAAIKESEGYKPWYEWKKEYRDRDKSALNSFIKENENEIKFRLFTQYMFFLQYNNLKSYANSKGIELFGDMPLYVALDSVDVWSHREIFQLEENGLPKAVAGVPPDAFSSEGQLWGNPLFDWEKLKDSNYEWWNKRIDRAFGLYDILRIDHFRGFDRYYSIDYANADAKSGEWKDGPKFDFFSDKLDKKIVAEDLGVIDDGVRNLLASTGFSGMKILSFAFNGDRLNPYLPSNFGVDCVVYTGTHDNLPLKAYLQNLNDYELNSLYRILKEECYNLNVPMRVKTINGLCDKIVELAFASDADLAVIPMWDFLHLGEEGRINFPSTLSEKNWSYRFQKSDFGLKLKERIKYLVSKYNR